MNNNEFRINPDKVTHIKISDKHKGIKGHFGDARDYIWLDGKVSKILGIKIKTYNSGFYLRALIIMIGFIMFIQKNM